ncbi:glycosyltransferase family 1 protein [Jeotgalibacillus sp. S-D1]|uniref:glycosyltransferase family 4 protein n=1 Tax=Jeotgalibacillus sp. S-D1 TaxID=2552189 RepID=UPI0010597D4E|nr:glycosyltransferase family 4 protein [Jeotgalibacillus sp. S-D1]TDL32513.1 glycosyltransferase family 1 protein [Jeotgalibacillus sp. S-D1]
MRNKILFVTTIARTVEAFLIPHIQYFLDKGFEVGVATNTENGPVECLTRLGVKVHHVPFSRTLIDWNNFKAYKEIKSVCRDYPIVHLHTPIASFLTRMASTKKQITIYTAHGFHFNENEHWSKNLFYKAMEKIAAFKTTKIIVTNNDDLKEAGNLFSAAKIDHVHGVGIDTDQFCSAHFSQQHRYQIKKELGINSTSKVITHIAEFNENKRQIDVVGACERLKKQSDDFVILLIGKGSNEELIKDVIEKKNLSKWIKCLGFVSDVPSVLSITDIGLLVSLREGLPRSVMEMMAMKIPVIGSNIRGIRDLVEDGKNGFLIPVKSPGRLADACCELLQDQELAEKFGEYGRVKIEQYYSLPIVLQEMETIYQQLSIK